MYSGYKWASLGRWLDCTSGVTWYPGHSLSSASFFAAVTLHTHIPRTSTVSWWCLAVGCRFCLLLPVSGHIWKVHTHLLSHPHEAAERCRGVGMSWGHPWEMEWQLTESELPSVLSLIAQLMWAFLPVSPILYSGVLPVLGPGSWRSLSPHRCYKDMTGYTQLQPSSLRRTLS